MTVASGWLDVVMATTSSRSHYGDARVLYTDRKHPVDVATVHRLFTDMYIWVRVCVCVVVDGQVALRVLQWHIQAKALLQFSMSLAKRHYPRQNRNMQHRIETYNAKKKHQHRIEA